MASSVHAEPVLSVRERPILFSGEMVRVILEGRKTQTRRVVTRRLKDEGEWCSTRPDRGYTPESIAAQFPNPYGQPGDQLWVRETWASLRFDYDHETGYCDGWEAVEPVAVKLQIERSRLSMSRPRYGLAYGSEWNETREERGFAWRPSIFMPRWASRLTLEITNVRVERVQDISDADCIAEGCSGGHDSIPGYGFSATPVEHYQSLWDRINSPRGYGWDVNPWVWVIEFRAEKARPA